MGRPRMWSYDKVCAYVSKHEIRKQGAKEPVCDQLEWKTLNKRNV